MPTWLRIESFAEAVTFIAVVLGALILVCTAIRLLRSEANTGAILIALALLGFALLLSPKLESFAFAGTSIKFFEATNALTENLTKNVEMLNISIAELSRRQTDLAGQVQKLAQGAPPAAASAELAPIIDQSKQLSEALEKAKAGTIMELQNLQRDLGTAVQRSIRGN